MVAIEQGCLAQQVTITIMIQCCSHGNNQAGVSPGDIIDEFAGHILHNPPQGKVKFSFVTSIVYIITMMFLALKNSKK